MTMTSYLLRWQWLILKRQLLSRVMIVNLIGNLIFQIGIVVAVLLDPKDYTTTLPMFVLYTGIMALSLTMTGFSQAMVVASMGVLGVAPLEHRPKMAMVLFSLMVVAVINAGLLAVGLGVSFLLHGDGLGALVVMALTFITSVFVFAGVGAGLTALLTKWLPARLRPQAGAVVAPFMVLLMSLFALLSGHYPNLLQPFSNVFMHIAAHPATSLRQIGDLLLAAGVGAVAGAIPFTRGFSSLSQQPMGLVSNDSRSYKQTTAPSQPGLFRLLLWRELVLLGRNKGLLLLPAVLILIFFSISPNMSGFGFLFLGVQIGAAVHNAIGVKALPLIYLAPIPLDKFWTRRLLILLPQALIISILFLIIKSVALHSVDWMTGIDDIAMTLLGVCAMSFFTFFMTKGLQSAQDSNPRRFSMARLTGRSLGMMLLTFVVPFGIAILNRKLPLQGFIVDTGLIVGFLLFGRTYLREKVSLQYPLGSQ